MSEPGAPKIPTLESTNLPAAYRSLYKYFADLQITETDEPDQVRCVGSGEFHVDGQTYPVLVDVRVPKMSYGTFSNGLRTSHESVNIYIGDRGQSLTTSFIFKPKSGYIQSEVTLLKDDVESKLPKGFGKNLYEKMVFDFLQETATARDEIVHDVAWKGSASGNRIEDERWLEIFRPILLKAGYRQLSEEEARTYTSRIVFVKDYHPET